MKGFKNYYSPHKNQLICFKFCWGDKKHIVTFDLPLIIFPATEGAAMYNNFFSSPTGRAI